MNNRLTLIPLLLASTFASLCAADGPGRPNLLLIFADDAGETRDLAADKQELRDALHAAWLEWCKPLPPRANPVGQTKTAAIEGLFSARPLTGAQGKPFTAYVVTTPDGIEYLLYYRLLKDRLAGRTPAELVGRPVRVSGTCNETGAGAAFREVTSIDEIGAP